MRIEVVIIGLLACVAVSGLVYLAHLLVRDVGKPVSRRLLNAVARRLRGAEAWSEQGVARAYFRLASYRVRLEPGIAEVEFRAPLADGVWVLAMWGSGYALLGMPLLKVTFGQVWLDGVSWVPAFFDGKAMVIGSLLVLAGVPRFVRSRQRCVLIRESVGPVRITWFGPLGVRESQEIALRDAAVLLRDRWVVLDGGEGDERIKLIRFDAGGDPIDANDRFEVVADLARFSEALEALGD